MANHHLLLCISTVSLLLGITFSASIHPSTYAHGHHDRAVRSPDHVHHYHCCTCGASILVSDTLHEGCDCPHEKPEEEPLDDLSECGSSEFVVSEGVPDEGAPGKDAPGKDVPGKDAPGKDDPEKGAPGKDAPDKGAPGKDAPGKDVLGKDAPGKDYPSKDAPGKDAPGKSKPDVENDPNDEAASKETIPDSDDKKAFKGYDININMRERR